jgi:hypothetical protein
MSIIFERMVGNPVTIDGTARNAAGGAVVLTDDRTPIYIDGLQSWDKNTDGKKIKVKGTLAKRGPDKVVNDKGEHAHGFADDRFVLEKPSWTVV